MSREERQLEVERAALVAEVRDAFKGVSRAGGVSWSEAVVIDRYGPDEARQAARESDHDSHWSQLVDDPKWQADTGLGGFSFLDAIGFRYYLPAAMIRTIRDGEDHGIRFHLTLGHESRTYHYQPEQLSLLDERQRRCIARFLRFMIRLSRDNPLLSRDWWEETYNSHWKNFAGDLT